MNYTVKLLKNGRITIPKELRDKHGWKKETILKWHANGEWVEVANASRHLPDYKKPSP